MRDDETPRHKKKAPQKKSFGIQETYKTFLGKHTRTRWFATEKARDQSYDDLLKKTTILSTYRIESETKKVNR